MLSAMAQLAMMAPAALASPGTTQSAIGRLASSDQLRAAVEHMRNAEDGSAELDQLVRAALRGAYADGLRPTALRDGASWSRELSDALLLLPAYCNYSLGERDGICWAWIQPNDDWHPGELEARHDHPGGSGLVVAATPALALTSAALSLYACQLRAEP